MQMKGNNEQKVRSKETENGNMLDSQEQNMFFLKFFYLAALCIVLK